MRKNIELPLTIFSRHISRDVGQLHDAINNSIVNIDIAIDPYPHQKFESYLADLKQDNFQASFIRYGANTNVQCLQDNYYCIVVPYAGQHCIRHREYNFVQTNKVSFIPPSTLIDMQYSADCGHLVLRFKQSPFIDEIFKLFYKPEFINAANIQESIYQLAMNFIHSNCFIKAHSDTEIILNTLKQEIYDLVLNNSEYRQIYKNENIEIQPIVEFINQNIKWDYNIEDLAALSNLPIRTLYWRFKKHTGITPYRYHLNCKLKCARLDILNFGNRLTVTEIATRYGFIHLSRFSKQYKFLFGELPNKTMKDVSHQR